MYTVTKDRPLATTITGSLPRPSWFVEDLRGRAFLEAIGSDYRYREQYFDAVAVLVNDQVRAGLDIVTDGDMRFDTDIGGRSWFGYLFERMDGLGDIGMRRGGSEWAARPRGGGAADRAEAAVARVHVAGDILHEVMEARLPARVLGEVGRGSLQYDAVFKAAQRLTERPVKIGSCCGQMVNKVALNDYYDSALEAVMAFSTALNEEYHAVADAGAEILQVEEPCLHFVEEATGRSPSRSMSVPSTGKWRGFATGSRSGATPAGAIRSRRRSRRTTATGRSSNTSIGSTSTC